VVRAHVARAELGLTVTPVSTRSVVRTVVVGLTAAITVGSAGTALAATPAASTAARLPVIVTEQPGAGNAPEAAVARLGGVVDRQLGIIPAFRASVPADRLDALRAAPGVREVTADAAVHLASTQVADQAGQVGSLASITGVIGAARLWAQGVTGKGVDVALIDSGVVPVDGLRTPGKVVLGPDLSLEAQQCDSTGAACSDSPANGLDGYGHGTAMAGIIAGRDDAAPSRLDASSGSTNFLGVAPDARIVSVKVADAGGSSDVSQVIAGIDWVVQHRTADGLNIRVLNLSFGTDSAQGYLLDPLAYAAEVAWRAGIVVVVSAGNTGASNGRLADPAIDPYVLAVGAEDSGGTQGLSDDTIPSWSQRGDGVRNPDLVAPGAAVVSLRAPGSLLDTGYPAARVGSRFFRGSGTSQAAAVASGAVALLLQRYPNLTNDQVKAMLTSTARRLPAADPVGQGHGLLTALGAMGGTPPLAVLAAQTWTPATGLGSLAGSRGSMQTRVGGVPLTGETDVTGQAWLGPVWAPSAAAGATWNGGRWNGAAWFGHGWNADHYAGQAWSGTSWVSAPWAADGSGSTATTWSGVTWSASMWAASMWAGDNWDASMWAASMWASSMWASSMWASSMWA
jgi:serine protease AprX